MRKTNRKNRKFKSFLFYNHIKTLLPQIQNSRVRRILIRKQKNVLTLVSPE